MAKHGRAPKPTPTPAPFKLEGADEITATYADLFMVTSESDTGMSSIYFFQSVLATPDFQPGQITTGQLTSRQRAKCVGRVILASKGVDVLLQALAQNLNLTLSPRSKEKQP